MSGKRLLFYLAVLLMVAGGYFFSEFRHSRQIAQEKAAKQVFQLKADDIKALTLKSDKGEIQLQRVAAAVKPPASSSAGTPGSLTSGRGMANYPTHCRQSGHAYHQLPAHGSG